MFKTKKKHIPFILFFNFSLSRFIHVSIMEYPDDYTQDQRVEFSRLLAEELRIHFSLQWLQYILQGVADWLIGINGDLFPPHYPVMGIIGD